MNNATICNTWFTKNPLYKRSWQHPRTKKWHAIDLVIVHQRDRQLCRDCRVICSADCGSDHRMVCLSLELPHATRFQRTSSSRRRPHFNISLPKPTPGMSKEERAAVMERVKSFQGSVTSSLTSLSTDSAQEQPSVEERWSTLRDSLVNAGCEHLGYVQRHQPDWFLSNQEVLEPLLQERRLCYNRWESVAVRLHTFQDRPITRSCCCLPCQE